MGAVYTIWLREIKIFTRVRSRVAGSLATPIFWLVFVGVGFNASFRFPDLSINYMDFITPGIIGMTLLFSAMFSGLSVLWDKQFGFMKEMLIAPVKRTTIVLGKTVGGTTIALFQGCMILLVSIAMGVNITLSGFLTALIFMVLISASFVSLGLVFASQMEDPHGFQMIMSFVMMPLFFLSGALFPIDRLPTWLKYLTYLDPLTYGVDGLRGSLIYVNQFPLWFDFSVLFVFFMVMISLGGYLFKRMEV